MICFGDHRDLADGAVEEVQRRFLVLQEGGVEVAALVAANRC